MKNQVFDRCASFLKKKRGENVQPRGIDLDKSYCNIKDNDILKKLEDIPYFKSDNDFIRIYNILVIFCIAHNIYP